MVIGITASFLGGLFAMYEHDNPDYWALWGISRSTKDLINILTSVFCPGGYVLILFAPGGTWIFNIGMLLLTHFVGIQLVGGLLWGFVGGRSAKRRLQREVEETLREESDEEG